MTDTMERTRPAHNRVSAADCSDPACTARLHGTDVAWRRHGCRSAEAEADHERFLAGQRASERKAERLAAEKARRIRRRTQRILEQFADGWDPRERWRGPGTRVSRATLYDAFHLGIYDPGTKRERQVLAWLMQKRPNRAGTGLMDNSEIAHRLGVGVDTIWRYNGERRELREQRTSRRAADALWRAYHKHGWRG